MTNPHFLLKGSSSWPMAGRWLNFKMDSTEIRTAKLNCLSFKNEKSSVFQCPRIQYTKKNCIFIATHSLVLMTGKRFLSCGVFVVQKVPLSGCIKGVQTGIYCSISCCLAEVSSDSFYLDEQYWGAVSSPWGTNAALNSLSPEPGLWNYAHVWPIKPCVELVTVFDQHIVKTFSWLGRNWVKWNDFPAGTWECYLIMELPGPQVWVQIQVY